MVYAQEFNLSFTKLNCIFLIQTYKKAMLQFCAQTNSSTYDDDEGVILSFHWGGKPIVIETDGDYFSGELVLATLHHGIIASNITVGAMG